MRRWRVVALRTLLPLALAACGSTEPDDLRSDGGLAVRLVHTPRYADVPVMDGVVRASCQVTFEAIRRTELQISWVRLQVVFYSDDDRRTPFDSISIEGDSVKGRWDGPLTVDNRPTADWTFSARRPYYARGRIRYRWGSAVTDTPDFTFRCVPEAPGGTSPAPTITQVSLTPSDTLDPGVPLTVRYRFSAPAGSWQESIRLTGLTCDTVVQRSTPLEDVVERETEIELPWECQLGDPITVQVRANDARQRQVSVQPGGPVVFTDRFAPTLSSAPLVGEFAVGAEYRPVVTFQENVGPTTIGWVVEPFGVRDSVRWGGNGAAVTLRIPAREGWTGPVTLKVFARDGQGLVSDTLRSVPDSLRVVPNVPRPLASRPMSEIIRTVIFDPKRPQVYLLMAAGPSLATSRISVRSTSTYDEIASFPVQDNVTSMDIVTSGDSLLVASGFASTLGVINLTEPSPVNRVISINHPALPASRIWSIVAGGGKVYISTFPVLLELTLANMGLRQLRQASYQLARSGDGSVISLSEGATTHLLHPGDSLFFASVTYPTGGFYPVSFSKDGSRASLGLRVYSGSLTLQQVLVASGEMAPREDIQLTPDGTSVLYLDQAQAGLIRKDLATGWAVERMPAWNRSGGNLRIRLSPDGSKAAIYDIANPRGADFVELTTQAGGVSGRR